MKRISYFNKLLLRYQQFGGWKLIKAYYRLGIASGLVKELVFCAIKGKPFKSCYTFVSVKMCKYLSDRYAEQAKCLSKKYNENDSQVVEFEDRNRIWFCWLQGMDNAPDLVKACLESLKRNLPNNPITIISRHNYSDFISLPDDIVQKYKTGTIPHAMFSDLIRLELLIKYGGTWIDSTVLCTNGELEGVKKIMSCNLFFFQYRDCNTMALRGIGNWFISADKGSMMLQAVRDMLFQYWRDHDCVTYYYIFHHFFMMLVPYYPKSMQAMPKATANKLLFLDTKMGEDLDINRFHAFTSKIPFHKLNYRVDTAVKKDPNNIYHYIINEYNQRDDK